MKEIFFKEVTAQLSPKAAYIFPGQGSFDVNESRNLYNKSVRFKEWVRKADELSKKFKFPSPLAYLTQKQKKEDAAYLSSEEAFQVNLLQLTQQCYLYEEFCRKLTLPNIVTAHSFGEYAAFYASGILNFETVYHIVGLREQASPAPGTLGGLVVLSSGTDEFRALAISKDQQIANINSKKQITVAVAKTNIKSFLRDLRANKIAATELRRVGRPYHSTLMSPSEKSFKESVLKIDFEISPVKIPLLSSVNQKIYEKEYVFERAELICVICEQLLRPVLFLKQIDSLLSYGVTGAVEMGSSSVVSPFVKSVSNGAIQSFSARDYEVKEEEAGAVSQFKIKDHKVFKMVGDFISQITGYSIEEIRLEQRLEEDLRIDSIKKAEILFRSFKERNVDIGANLEIAKLKRVGDIVQLLEGMKQRDASLTDQEVHFELKKGSWVQVPHPILGPIGEEPALQTLLDGDDFALKQFATDKYLMSLKTLSKNDLGEKEIVEKLNNIYSSLAQIRERGGNFYFILSGQESRWFNAVKAFLKCIALEFGTMAFKAVDVDSSSEFEKAAYQEFFEHSLKEIRYRGGRRESLALTALQPEDFDLGHMPRHVFSIGGSKGILKTFFEGSSFPDTHLTIVGRSNYQPTKVNWKSVTYLQVDAENPSSLLAALKKAESNFGEIDLIFDASGREYSQLFERKEAKEIIEEIRSKNLSVEGMSRYFSSRSLKPTIYKLNSISASHGNMGQSIYAFSNEWACWDDNITPIYLPPTDQVGMTEDPMVLRSVKMLGLKLLSADHIVELFKRLMLTRPKSVYLMSDQNQLMTGFQGQPNPHAFMSIGRRRDSDLHFYQTLDLAKQNFLNDHKISGQRIAPASLFFAELVVAYKSYFQAFPNLESYDLKNLITLEVGPVEVRTVCEFPKEGVLRIKVQSQLENFETVSGSLIQHTPLGFHSGLNLQNELEIGDFYSDKFLELSGMFVNLEWVRVDSQGRLVGKLKKYQKPAHLDEETYQLMNTFEACFLMVGGQVMWSEKMTMVPAHLSNVSIDFSKKGECRYILVKEIRPLSDSRWEGKCDVLNDEGQVVMSLNKMQGEIVIKYETLPVGYHAINESLW
ncbi:hypothetical protein AZI86_06050 [Bdellovibrio bacteriovorus]|uniref:Malonyl-CoA:ACP transacylase (MAT) domain-containing protein n=1 Tax=Bdellovibrio bacteriovorus TaxID=959 RepID=A0A150WQX6_BDEBC|nr:acyltransferase domain-containing protein [Bdellovibrio bacteriovorus]KYG66605.1 hypothetical protein AZI86_06050 [Bdellovibrio bacteriovorus]